jgi:Na+-translocating ferredoxin:NAD+ oxidoreductase RnfG subunit
MENFKLSKTGIIIIIIAAVMVILLCSIFYVAGKKAAEIKQETGKQNAIGNEDVDNDKQYYQLFDDYRAGKFTSKEAIEKSGLSCGMFYRKLKKYESKE